jgi:hypothetical protein
VEIVLLCVTVASLAFACFSYFHARAERRRHEQTVEDLRQRSEAITELNGILREIQHCTDEPGGLERHEEPLRRHAEEARRFARRKERLLGEDVIGAVHRETDLARSVFAEQRSSGSASAEMLGGLVAARVERAAMLHRLNASLDFPPPQGALVSRPSEAGERGGRLRAGEA